MKHIISLISVYLFFTCPIIAQEIEGEKNQKKIESIFNTAQEKFFYSTSLYIIKIGVNGEIPKDIKEVDIQQQLNTLKFLPTAYNCLVKAKYPNSTITRKSKGLYVKKSNGALCAYGRDIIKDTASLNRIIFNIVTFLTDITAEGTTFPYRDGVDSLKVKLDEIVKNATKEAGEYLLTNDYQINSKTEESVANELEPDKKAIIENNNPTSSESLDSAKNITANTEKEDEIWKNTQNNNTVDGYNLYIQAYPKGKYLKNANNAINALEVDGKSNNIIYVLSVLSLLTIFVLAYIIAKNKKKLKEKEEEIEKLKTQKEEKQPTSDINLQTENNKVVGVAKTNDSSETIEETTLITPVVSTPKPQINSPLIIDINGGWILVGASVIGKSHVETGKPCQDSHSYTMLNNEWGIAVTSDGAGSAKHSDIGSKAVSKMATKIVFKKIVEENKWHLTNELPSQEEWSKIAKKGMLEIYAGLKQYAIKNNYTLTDLACTLIVNVFSPKGLLVTHIGDGRAGYRTINGEWKASITPHSGEESNQTIFITSAPWLADENFQMSGVSVPESRVINEKIVAFTSMSDGGEAHLFESSKIDPISGKWSDPNKPAALFDKHIKTIIDNKNDNSSSEELNQMWEGYITNGNTKLANEPDDKTVILGVFDVNK
jgi:hypothetical protein